MTANGATEDDTLKRSLTRLLVQLNHESMADEIRSMTGIAYGTRWTVERGAEWLIERGVILADGLLVTTPRGTLTYAELLEKLDRLDEFERGDHPEVYRY